MPKPTDPYDVGRRNIIREILDSLTPEGRQAVEAYTAAVREAFRARHKNNALADGRRPSDVYIPPFGVEDALEVLWEVLILEDDPKGDYRIDKLKAYLEANPEEGELDAF